MRIPLLLLAAVIQTAAPSPGAPPIRELANGISMLPGAMLPERGPDGNTILITAPDGLIVIDTGRHAWHSDAILAFARDRRLTIPVIINTHWHLDHSSGNGRLKAHHPGARVHTGTAVERAIAAGGFLARSVAAAREHPADANASATRKEEASLFLATMEAEAALRPDVAVDASGTRILAGRPLSIRLVRDAVTDSDLWLFDEPSGLAILGDLVTLPAPFFESACPAGWEGALDEVWATPFRTAIPGHGPPLSREEFDVYRQGFKAFRACVAGPTEREQCAAGWVSDIARLLTSDAERRQASDYAAYYVDFLRKTGGKSTDCRAQ